jgi:hypothetical protein
MHAECESQQCLYAQELCLMEESLTALEAVMLMALRPPASLGLMLWLARRGPSGDD